MSASERIKEAMKEAGIESAADLARLSGLNPVTVRAYLNDYRNLSFMEPATRLASALGVSPEWLLGTSKTKRITADNDAKITAKRVDNRPFSRVTAAPVRGIAEASTWREYEEFDYSDLDPIPVIPGKWAHLEQFAYRVSGPSMDKAGILDGTFVVCVPYFLARGQIIDNDTVVVERRRASAIERTVKKLKVMPDRFELWPESTHPRWQQPIVVKPNGQMHEDDGTTVEIVGLVIGRYAPM